MNKKTDKYAVVRLAGKQYKVSEGEEVLVDKLIDTKSIESEILLFVNGDKVEVGKPIVKNLKLQLDVVHEVEKGEKVKIFKYKSKSRYRRRAGFRPKKTRLLIKSIS